MKSYRSYNKYDVGLIILIASLVVGDLGGALQPARIVALLFLPNILFKATKINELTNKALLFFILWFVYILCSLSWTSDLSQGIKEVFYYITHFSLFVLIQHWAKKALNPLRSIITGWLTLFLLSCPVALYELIYDWHFASSSKESGYMMNMGDGMVLQKKFAALNFLNYNTYVTVLCFCSPFMFAFLLYNHTFTRQAIGWTSIAILTYILLMNASRGGLLCLTVYSIFFYLSYRYVRFKGRKLLISGVLLGLTICLIYYSDVLFEQIAYRFINRDSVFEDSSRSHLISVALQLFANSYGMGTGVGSIVASMRTMTSGVIIPHNMFLEVLVQYGLVIFCICGMFFLTLYRNAINQPKHSIQKYILYSALAAFPFLFVINAGYLLMPSFWTYMSCLAFISQYQSRNYQLRSSSVLRTQ